LTTGEEYREVGWVGGKIMCPVGGDYVEGPVHGNFFVASLAA